jgi:uncharacterized FAD-dependent dehydrogenase
MRMADITLWHEEAFNESLFPTILYGRLGLPNDGSVLVTPVKRSIDARGKKVCVHLQVEIYSAGERKTGGEDTLQYQDVDHEKRVVIVGAGPGGLFAALRLIELGVKPIVLERGKDVRSRRRDLAAINKEHIVNPESNYCFGEGGAGTYSDGKLYTRSKKRGDIRKILSVLVAHGARNDILFDAHPHIGTNKLPLIVAALRERILAHGGEIHFNTRVTDLIIDGDTVKGVATEDGSKIEGEAVILATGHSARDIFHLMHKRDIAI